MTRLPAHSALLLAALVLMGRAAAAAEPTKRECVDANSSAQDLRKDGKLRAARDKLALCVSMSCPGAVREDCAQRLDEVNKAMPSLVFEAKDTAGNDLGVVRVTMDGQPLAEKLDGTAIPVDPGSHLFAFEAERLPKAEKTLIVREGDQGRRERVVVGPAAPTVAPSDHGPPHATIRTATSEQGSSHTPMAAYVAFAAGGVGLIAGTVFTVLGLGAKSDAENSCPAGPSQCPAAVDVGQLNGRITSNNIGAGIGFGLAAVGGGVGTILLLTSGSPSAPAQGVRVEPRVGAGWAGVGGSF